MIEEARGESIKSVASLFGSLSEYKGKMKFKQELNETDDNKKKGIALKAVKEKEVDEPEDEDDELIMMVRRFGKFYKKD